MSNDLPKFVSVTPAQPGWHAVYASDDGEPELEPVACWAVHDVGGEQRLVAMTRAHGSGAALQPADLDPMFVGLASPGEEAEDWEEACREHVEDLDAEGDDDLDDEEDEDDDEAASGHASAE